jgi:uncharacterized membrane protein YvlD (DUF360 family)
MATGRTVTIRRSMTLPQVLGTWVMTAFGMLVTAMVVPGFYIVDINAVIIAAGLLGLVCPPSL